MKTERVIVRLTANELATLHSLRGQTISQKIRYAIQTAKEYTHASDIQENKAEDTQKDEETGEI